MFAENANLEVATIIVLNAIRLVRRYLTLSS